MIRLGNTIGSLAIAGFVAVAFSAAPVGLDNDFSLAPKAAFAKGKGSGNSGGHGGGSHSSRSSKSNKGGKSGNGIETEGAHGNGQGDDFETAEHESHNDKGELTSAMGNLNAAHASPTALEHASDDSVIGKLRAYVEDFLGDNETTTEQQRDALGAISNKADEDGRVDEAVVTGVNTLLEPPPSE